MHRHHLAIAAGVLLGLGVLTGCGDEPPRPPAAPAVERTLPDVPVLPARERARYALDRLMRGPAPLRGLLVKDIHRRNLELAFADLIAMEREATALLSDPAVRTRVVEAGTVHLDPWHNVLRLMMAFERQPTALIAAWTRPVLAMPRHEDFDTLRAEAARLLGQVPGSETAEILLALFEQAPADREIGAVAFSALMRVPSHREAAFDMALRHGAPSLWAAAWSRIAGVVPAGEIDAEVAGALAWWVGLTAGSGPRLPAELPLLKSQPWMQARLGIDPRIPEAPWTPDGRRLPVFAALPSETMLGSGWFATDLAGESVFPAQGYMYTGKLPAAEGRCVLARWNFEGYRAAVFADAFRGEMDEGLGTAAQHCMLDAAPTSAAEALAAIDDLLAETSLWDRQTVRTLQQKVDALPVCTAPGVWERLVRILRDVRPLDAARPVLDQVYEAMRAREFELVPLITAMLRGTPEDAGVALYLVRRARDPVYLTALEDLLDGAQDASLRRVLQRTLIFIYARGFGIEPQRYEGFIRRYEAWIAEADPRRAPGLATGLLDLGDAGAEAFARGLRGTQRELYLAAWPRNRRLVPLSVAAALIEPVTAQTPLAERMRVLAYAYINFPRAADRHLEALRLQLPLAERGPADAALERVRHRAERHAELAGRGG